jgi:hypothetical protein
VVAVYGNASPPPPSSTPGGGSNSGTRYNYLVGRLRNRQITMEEATELFALMQGMIARANEIARATAMRTSSTSPAVPVAPVPEAPKLATGPSSSDDLLLVGILAMGAGAGLIAALARRMGEPPVAPPPVQSKSGAAPR